MSLENLQKRRTETDAQMQQRQKEITDLRTQVDNAETTIRQWTDLQLIQRGQLIELDAQINELLDLEVPEEKSKKKRGKKKDEESGRQKTK